MSSTDYEVTLSKVEQYVRGMKAPTEELILPEHDRLPSRKEKKPPERPPRSTMPRLTKITVTRRS